MRNTVYCFFATAFLYAVFLPHQLRAEECPSFSSDPAGFSACIRAQCRETLGKLRQLRCQLRIFKSTRKTLTSLADLQAILVFINSLERRIKRLAADDDASGGVRECNRRNSKTTFIIENNTQLPVVVFREPIDEESSERLGSAGAETITRLTDNTLPGRNALFFDPFLESTLNDPNIEIYRTEVVERIRDEAPCQRRVTIELFDENFGVDIVVVPTPHSILPGDDIDIVCPQQLTDKNGVTGNFARIDTITNYGALEVPTFVQVSCFYLRVFQSGSTSTAPFIIFTFAKDRGYFDRTGFPFVCVDENGPDTFSSRQRQFRVFMPSNLLSEAAAAVIGPQMLADFSRIAATCG